MSDALTSAVVRLLSDRRFLTRFRRDPDAALASYKLTSAQVEAIKRGDRKELLSLGLDPAISRRQPPSRPLMASLAMTLAGGVAAPVLLALIVGAWPAGTSHAMPTTEPTDKAEDVLVEVDNRVDDDTLDTAIGEVRGALPPP